MTWAFPYWGRGGVCPRGNFSHLIPFFSEDVPKFSSGIPMQINIFTQFFSHRILWLNDSIGSWGKNLDFRMWSSMKSLPHYHASLNSHVYMRGLFFIYLKSWCGFVGDSCVYCVFFIFLQKRSCHRKVEGDYQTGSSNNFCLFRGDLAMVVAAYQVILGKYSYQCWGSSLYM